MFNGSHPISREGRVARSVPDRVVKLTNIILNTLCSPHNPQTILSNSFSTQRQHTTHGFPYFYLHRELLFCTCIVNLTNMIVIVFAF